MIDFGAGGGTLTAKSLLASTRQLAGAGVINTRGLVCDVDLVFDSTQGLTQTLTLNSEPAQDITIHLDVSDGSSGNGCLGAGYRANGSLAIRDGIVVSGEDGYLGYGFDSLGVASIDGAGSTWTNSRLQVGLLGHGVLKITDGGSVVSNDTSALGYSHSSTGVVNVEGVGSTWATSNVLIVGHAGNGTLNVTGGGTISGDMAVVGNIDGSTGKVRVDGSDSNWTNSGVLYVGISGNGALNITDGGAVSATSVSINNQSLLAIEVSGGSQLTIDSDSGTIDNDGVVRIIAGVRPAAGAVYTPIFAGGWEGAGTYESLGGVWDDVTHEVTASPVIQSASEMPLDFDLAAIQRVLVDDSASGWSVGASLLAADVFSMLNFTATAIDGQVLDDLQDHLDPGDTVLGAWKFAASGGYTPGDPAYLSFDVGAGQAWDDLQIWQYDGADWSEYDATDLVYDGQYASFTVTDLTSYAVTPIKEIWIPGDCDGDNRVDADDAAIMAEHWGQSGDWAEGDFNDDGVINALDAAILAANWNPGSSTEATAVPEPSMLVMLLGLPLLPLFTRRRGLSGGNLFSF